MTKCSYPNCHHEAIWIPVLELPTLRSVGDSQAMVQTTRPTVLLFVVVCEDHKRTYNMMDWMKPGDWAAMQDVAHENGYFIPDPTLVAIQFKPLGWIPQHTLELERG